MADLTITPADVVPQAGASLTHGDIAASGGIVAGQPYYLNGADSNKATLCDSTSATKAAPKAIAVNSAAAGQPVSGIVSGRLAVGAVLTASVGYGVADTAGGIRPLADNGSGDFITSLGIAETASTLLVNLHPTGVAK